MNDDSYESFGVTDDIDGLLAAADAKRSGLNSALTRRSHKPAKKKKTNKKPAAAARSVVSSAAPGSAPSRRKKAAQRRPAQTAHRADPIPPPGLITWGIDRGYQSLRACSLWGWLVVLVGGVLVWASHSAWRQMPERWQPRDFVITSVDGSDVPRPLVADLLKHYPQVMHLARPTPELLQDFAAYLTRQAAIAAVDRVAVCYQARAGAPARQILRADLRLRRAVLPVQLRGGVRQSVDAEGVLLPASIEAPAGVPVVRGYNADVQREALREVLGFWPALAQALPANQIASIHLADDLQRPGQRGIVLHMRNNTRILWGQPGEARYGVSQAHKIRQIVHALQCRGNSETATVIDARFYEAVYPTRS